MNTKSCKTRLVRILSLSLVLILAFSVTGSASAAGPRSFVGVWRAIDIVDGSLIRATIVGPARGPFLITWTESYFSFCDGRAGISVGKGWLDPADPYTLEADMRLKCLRTGDTVDWHQVWKYKPDYNVLASYGYYGVETIWTRLGHALVPRMDLRVNYGHDWVESFYEAGHTALVTVTETDGVTVKATIEVQTEPKDYWGGESGFQSLDGFWYPGTPDIQPGDWVFAQVDNGQTARVQIGDISGMIDLNADSTGGTIKASWFAAPVQVECLDWGSGQEPPYNNADGGFVLPNGADPYSCSWAGEWDIQPGQTVGVGYSGPDGHWVANVFFVINPTFVAYLPYAIEGYDWSMGDEIRIFINDVEFPVTAISEQRPGFPEGSTRVLFDVGGGGISLQAGDHIVMTDEVAGVTKEVWVTNLTVTDFDLNAGKVFGTYDPAYDLWAWLYDLEGQVPETDPDNRTWIATFTELPPGGWGGATQWDGDGDGTSIDFQVPNTRVVIANQPDRVNSGIDVSAGQSFTIEAFGLMNPCSDTYPNGVDYCIFYTPPGAEGVVPYENEFGIFPGPGLRFMALLGRIGDGEPFYVGAGGTFTAEQAGTLWFTPNDNLRTDNQGAYSVLVWLEQ